MRTSVRAEEPKMALRKRSMLRRTQLHTIVTKLIFISKIINLDCISEENQDDWENEEQNSVIIHDVSEQKIIIMSNKEIQGDSKILFAWFIANFPIFN